jgi:hypothetical protein
VKIEVSIRRFVLSALVFAAGSVSAATYYVSTAGSDSNPGTSAQPFRTITNAYSRATAGETIIVSPGVYTDYRTGWGLHLGKSGTASSPITLKSEVLGAAIIEGQNASDRNVGIYIDGSYNVVDGFEIRNGTKGGITIWANGNQILNCNIHNNGNPTSTSTQGKDGVYSSEGTSGNFYSGNYIHHNGRTGSNLDHGLYLCGENEAVINNVLFANATTGLQIAGYTTVRNLKVYNNVMAFNGSDGIILWQDLSGVDIKNNIFYRNGHWGIGSYAAHGSGVVVDHNLSFGNGSGHFNFTAGKSDYSYTLGLAIYTDPLFVNGTTNGFDAHLTAASPAVLAGLNLFSLFTTDQTGTGRQSSGPWDLGAYQYGSATVGGSMVSVTASLPTATIGTTNYGALTFARSGDTTQPLTVNYTLGGTAVKLIDYYRPVTADMPVAITIPPGAAAYTMNIAARTNSTGANPQYVTLTLAADPFYQVGATNTATITFVSNAPVSAPPITVGIRQDVNGMAVSWNSVGGKIYRVSYKDDLGDSWADLSGNITSGGDTTSWTDTGSGGVLQRFYRVYSTN